MFEPLYTAEEMRAAEQGHDVDAMMERAGRAVADAVLGRYPDARRIGAACGKGANGGPLQRRGLAPVALVLVIAQFPEHEATPILVRIGAVTGVRLDLRPLDGLESRHGA